MLITLHGLNETDPNYAESLIKNSETKDYIQLFIEPLLETKSNSFLEKLTAGEAYSRTHLKSERTFLAQFVGDMYQYVGNDEQAIISDISSQLMKYTEIHGGLSTKKLNLVLHSWGCCLFFDKRFEEFRSALTWDSITTLGCPVALYSLSNNLGALQQNNWTNFWHSDDVFSSPMANFGNATDIEVTDTVPDWIVGQIELIEFYSAHNGYFGSKQVAEHIKTLEAN